MFNQKSFWLKAGVLDVKERTKGLTGWYIKLHQANMPWKSFKHSALVWKLPENIVRK